jgi:hypothetical protein
LTRIAPSYRPRSKAAATVKVPPMIGVCAIIGGTLTVAAALDRGLYEGAMRVKKLHSNI